MNDTMTIPEMKRAIVRAFKSEYGFAPTLKSIIPIETLGYYKKYTWIGFRINGKGYNYRVSTKKIVKDENYNM